MGRPVVNQIPVFGVFLFPEVTWLMGRSSKLFFFPWELKTHLRWNVSLSGGAGDPPETARTRAVKCNLRSEDGGGSSVELMTSPRVRWRINDADYNNCMNPIILVITGPRGLSSLIVLAFQPAFSSFFFFFCISPRSIFSGLIANYKVTASLWSLVAASSSTSASTTTRREGCSRCCRWNTEKKNNTFVFLLVQAVTLINHLSQRPWTEGNIDKLFQGSYISQLDKFKRYKQHLWGYMCIYMYSCEVLPHQRPVPQRQVDCPDFKAQRGFRCQRFCFAADNGVIVPCEEVSP